MSSHPQDTPTINLAHASVPVLFIYVIRSYPDPGFFLPELKRSIQMGWPLLERSQAHKFTRPDGIHPQLLTMLEPFLTGP